MESYNNLIPSEATGELEEELAAHIRAGMHATDRRWPKVVGQQFNDGPQQGSLHHVLAALAMVTPPQSWDRAELVARLQKLLDRFAPSASDEGDDPSPRGRA